MKKAIAILGFICIGINAYSQNDFYNLSFLSPDNKRVHMSDYWGKKVVIVTADPKNFSLQKAPTYLGKIQSEFTDVVVIVLPVVVGKDTAGVKKPDAVRPIKNTAFSSVSYVDSEKVSELKENPVLGWLMRERNGQHFKREKLVDEQIFVISESGTLYAVLDKQVSDRFLKAVLTAPDVKQ